MLCKRHKQSTKVWVRFAEYLITEGKPAKARELLEKALKVLPKHKHVQTIEKFAVMEFRHGTPERGRTIFEGVLSSYPKRADIWHVYVDQEIKLMELGGKRARALLERVVSSKWSTKKMKAFFKKYLQFEQECGTTNHVDHVKALARAYVESQVERQAAADESE